MSIKSTKQKIGSLLKKAPNGNEYVNYSAFMSDEISTYFILGHRGDGKTYGAMDLALTEYWKSHTPSVYVRRLDDSIGKSELADLLNPFGETIVKASGEKYNEFDYKSKKFYPVFNTEGKISARGKPILHCTSLNTWQNSKGSDRGLIKYFVFDEAIDERAYLKNEIKAFKNTMSTFVRDRTDVTALILANPLNPYCPYFDHYGIQIEKMKQNEVTDIHYPSGEVLRFVWLPESKKAARSKRGILYAGNTQASITSGAWDVGQYRVYVDTDLIENAEFLFAFQITFQRITYAVRAFYINGLPIDGVKDVDGVAYIVCPESFDVETPPYEMQITDMSIPLVKKCDEVYDFYPMNSLADEFIKAFKDHMVYYDSNTTGAAIEQWLKVVVGMRGRVNA